MKYEIKEVHLIYSEKGLSEVAVLWADGEAFRATYANSIPKFDFQHFTEETEPNNKLFQKVAAYGSYLDDGQKKKFFKHIKKWSK